MADWINSDIERLNDNIVAAIGGGIAPVARVLTSGIAINPGISLGAGANKITIVTSGDFTGTINGEARDPNLSITFDAGLNNTLPGIACVVTAGSITYDVLT